MTRVRFRSALACGALLTLALLIILRCLSTPISLFTVSEPQCRLSDITAGPWRRWPRRLEKPGPSSPVESYPPAGVSLPSLLRMRPLALPPHPVVASFPVPALPPASAAAAAPTTLLLILVKSAPDNADFRQAVRDTWGDLSYWPQGCLLRFLVGSPASQDLLAEASQHGDVIVHGEGDGYRNNTRKLLAGIVWAVRFLSPGLRLVLLADDDLLLNPFAAGPLLTAAGWATPDETPVLAGHLVAGARPVRPGPHAGDPRGKWALAYDEYPFTRYPDYLSAGWLLMSARLLPDLLWAAGFVTPRLPFDDVYLGLLAAKLRLPLTDLSAVLDLDSDGTGEAGGAGDARTPRSPGEQPSSAQLLARHGYRGGGGGGGGGGGSNNGASSSRRRLLNDWRQLVGIYCK